MNHEEIFGEALTLARDHDAARVLFDLMSAFPESRVYLVGGAVRDLMMRRPVTDIDFVVGGVEPQRLESFLKERGDVVFVGKAFGVFVFHHPHSHVHVDIALPRTEKSVGDAGRYTDFEVTTDFSLAIEHDLSRRDFTINAMAVDMRLGELIDPFGGQADIQAHVIRAVRDPALRFREDRTRLMRALRLAVTLGFSFDAKTWEALCAQSLGLPRPGLPEAIVSPEVIAKELVKMFAADPVRSFTLLEESGFLPQVFPEIEALKRVAQSPNYHSEGDVYVHTKLALEQFHSSAFLSRFGTVHSCELPFAVLFHDLGKAVTSETVQEYGELRITFHGHPEKSAEIADVILRRMAFASIEGFDCEKILWLIRHHLFSINSLADQVRPTTLERLFLEQPERGTDLFKLMFADLTASIRPGGGHADLQNFDALQMRVHSLRSVADMQHSPLVTGDDLMREFQLAPSALIGKMLRRVRDEQLLGRIRSRDDALRLLRDVFVIK